MQTDLPTREGLVSDFEEDVAQFFHAGRVNNITDIGLSILSVVGSLIATILAAANTERWVFACFAAIPAASASLQQIVDFRGRSVWYFDFSAKLSALVFALKYASNPDIEEFARRRGELEIESEKGWAQVGGRKSGGKTRQRRA